MRTGGNGLCGEHLAECGGRSRTPALPCDAVAMSFVGDAVLQSRAAEHRLQSLLNCQSQIPRVSHLIKCHPREGTKLGPSGHQVSYIFVWERVAASHEQSSM